LLTASAAHAHGPLWMSRKRPAFARRGSTLQSGHHVHLPTRSLIGFENMAGMERGSWAYSGSSRNVYWIYLESRPCSQANARALLKPSLEAQHTPRPSPTFTACQGVFLTSCADLFRKYNTTAPQFTEGGEPRPHPLCSYRWTRFHLLTCDCFCLCLPAQGADRLVMPTAFSDRLTTWPALSRRGRGGRCAHCPTFAQGWRGVPPSGCLLMSSAHASRQAGWQ
jgi:hypothetical protein